MKRSRKEQSAVERVRARRRAKRRRKTLRTMVLVCAALALVLVPYVKGRDYYATRYFPRTSVAGVDASGMTEDELVQVLDSMASSYKLRISNGSFAHTVTGPSIDLSCDGRSVAHDLMAAQDPSNWPASLMGTPASRDVDLRFSRYKLNEQIRQAVDTYNATVEPAQSASIKYNKESGSFVVLEEVQGEVLDAMMVCDAAADAVSEVQTSLALASDVLVPPTIVADSAQVRDALYHANACLELTVPLMRNGKQFSSIPPEMLSRWIKVLDDLTTTVDQKAVEEWVSEYLWTTLDYANEVAVMSVDAPAFAKALAQAVGVDGDGKVEVPYIVTPRYIPGAGKLAKTKWKPALGRYIDVDKKAQVATLFDDDGRVLWESEITTGNEAEGNGTPVGEFGIYDKVTDFVLVGLDKNNDGKPDYESHVDYWMPFNGNIGLHDASWREEFGGEEYKTNGSGGCVNLPVKAASQLYPMTHINEVVIVHE